MSKNQQQADNSGYQTLKDCEGVAIDSGEPFRFACCDCGLVHNVVIVSQDNKPVGFAVKRDKQATVDRRKTMKPNLKE